MQRKVLVSNYQQFSDAVAILTDVGGTFHGFLSPENERVLLVNAEQYDALVKHKVIQSNGKKGTTRGKKNVKKKR